MFPLILSILGIGYCVTKLTSEKIQSKIIDKKIADNHKTYVANIEKYEASRDFINDIEDRYLRGDLSLHDEVHDVFDSIPSLNGLRMSKNFRHYDPYSYNRQTTKSILMAKHGQIDSITSRGPVFYGITTEDGKLLSFTPEQRKDLGRWAQTEIRKFHPECNIVWVSGSCAGDLQIDTLMTVHDKYKIEYL